MSDRWKSSNLLERALLLDWESKVYPDPHDGGPPFTWSVERGSGADRQVLYEGSDAAIADAIESAIYVLDALLAHARGEMPS
jgi:hypothetical protein